jgi:Ca2+-binding RTX toxin-like protein
MPYHYGTEGNNFMFGTYSPYTSNDVMYGYGGNDEIQGYGGSDTLYGGAGNDELAGTYVAYGAQYDYLVGGSGDDTFILGSSYWGVLYAGSGYATIADWNPRHDTIVLRGSANQYRLDYGNWGGSSATDTEIYYRNDLVGLVLDRTTFNASSFTFV